MFSLQQLFIDYLDYSLHQAKVFEVLGFVFVVIFFGLECLLQFPHVCPLLSIPYLICLSWNFRVRSTLLNLTILIGFRTAEDFIFFETAPSFSRDGCPYKVIYKLQSLKLAKESRTKKNNLMQKKSKLMQKKSISK